MVIAVTDTRPSGRCEDVEMGERTLELARAGDGTAFAALTDPYRRELLVHCYRLLGSVHDAEDAMQDTLTAAWRGLADFEARSSIRTWLYRIATNRCLNALRSRSRHPQNRPLPHLPGRPAGTDADRRGVVARPVPGFASFRPARQRARTRRAD
jgi:DNA-directed RNA polymerase specialized sigma24 family protein